MTPMNLFFRRRPWGGAIALGLLIGGILVTGAGAILWGKNALDRKAPVQARWKQAEGILTRGPRSAPSRPWRASTRSASRTSAP